MNPLSDLTQLIGPSRALAQQLFLRAALLKPGCPAEDRRFMLRGTPGTGKTTIAWTLACQLANKFEINDSMGCTPQPLINGQMVTVERVTDWQVGAHYRPMFGDWKILLIDEIDQASPAAVGQLRTYLDWLPAFVIFICTTNKTVKALPEPLQTRFIVYEFPRVDSDEIHEWLKQQHPNVPDHELREIAIGSNGNVRAAQIEAKDRSIAHQFA